MIQQADPRTDRHTGEGGTVGGVKELGRVTKVDAQFEDRAIGPAYLVVHHMA